LNACRLRLKDIDLEQQLIFVRDGKGGKDKTTLLPASLIPELRENINRVLLLHYQDIASGYGSVLLPDALTRKYPNACTDRAWQWLFPSRKRAVDPESNMIRRHHISTSAVQRAMKVQSRKANSSANLWMRQKKKTSS